MAKSFSDIMSNAGYSTKRADNPSVLRTRQNTGLGAGTSSDSSDSGQGPSCVIEDDVNGKRLNTLGVQQNNVQTAFQPDERKNPFIDPTAKIITTVKEAVSGQRVRVPLELRDPLI
jgi:hypothetical protein